MKNIPFIKWTGSKRKLAPQIIDYFPKNIDTYYEPMVGGGSMFFYVLENIQDIQDYYISDRNPIPIKLLQNLKESPNTLSKIYTEFWNTINSLPDDEDKEGFYKRMKDEFNKTNDPDLFYCLNKVCYNGMIRYSKDGLFNTPFHKGRTGCLPKKVIQKNTQLHNLISTKNVIIQNSSYLDIDYKENSLVYLDPPYPSLIKEFYHWDFDFVLLNKFLKRTDIKIAISMGQNYDEKLLPQLNQFKKIILSGYNSSHRRLNNENKVVNELLFINY